MRQGALIDRVPHVDLADVDLTPRACVRCPAGHCHVLLENPELCHALASEVRDRALILDRMLTATVDGRRLSASPPCELDELTATAASVA